jgi:UDP-glucose 4-epimerase
MLDWMTQAAPRPTRVLITGGAGFVGSHLSEALLNRGYMLTVLDDLSTGSLANIRHLIGSPRFDFVNGSITDEAVLEDLVADCDLIFHLAAAVGVSLIVDEPLRGIDTNVEGTQVVLKLARRYGRGVLIASTSEVYGKSTRTSFHEDDDLILGPTSKSRWSYATAKALDEFLGLAYHDQTGLPVVIFRLFNTVGPRQTGRYGMVVPRLVEQALRGERLTVYGDGRQSRCFCDVQDVVRALIGLAESPLAVGRVFNVGSTREVTILELASKVLEVVDQISGKTRATEVLEERIRFVPYEQAYGPGFEDMRRRCPDISRINEVTGWAPRVTLEETLRRVCASIGQDLVSVPVGA